MSVDMTYQSVTCGWVNEDPHTVVRVWAAGVSLRAAGVQLWQLIMLLSM